MQLNTFFYPARLMHSTLSNTEDYNAVALYMVASLVNNTTQHEQPTLDDAHEWLKSLPQSIAVQVLRDLPAPILDVLRERLFAAAIRAGDVDTVLSLIGLGADLWEKIKIETGTKSMRTSPINAAMRLGHFSVAEAITRSICRRGTKKQLDEFLEYLASIASYTRKITMSEYVELMCIALSAGANPNRNCLSAVAQDFDLAKRILETGRANTSEWLQVWSYEARYLGGIHDFNGRLVHYFFHERLHELPIGDPALEKTILNMLRSAIEGNHCREAETILDALRALRCDTENLDSIIRACQNADWMLARKLVSGHSGPTKWPTYERSTDQLIAERQLWRKELSDAVSSGDQELICDLMEEDIRDIDCDIMGKMVRRAVELGHDHIAAMIVITLEKWFHGKSYDGGPFDSLIVLLELGATETVSKILQGNPTWSAALESANLMDDFGALAEILFLTTNKAPYISFTPGFDPMCKEQILLRTVSYHAIDTKNEKLCRWLLKHGLDTDELIYIRDWKTKASSLSKRPDVVSFLGPIRFFMHGNSHVFPSLVAIAAQSDSVEWMTFLFAEGAKHRDSMSLLHAVRHNSGSKTLNMLLGAAARDTYNENYTYGARALREAVRNRDLETIDFLSGNVDIDKVESSTKEMLTDGEIFISPLGEAIKMESPELVQLLLHKGADPNSLVAYQDLKLASHINSALTPVSPLLAAIDVQNIAIVRLLVASGAEIDYSQKTGLLRTPLQRAAEIGNFDIVRYLVDEEASIDTVPVYSGATALQLAAMNGYVGIATFLLERGANPNHPPAYGRGRTAFEAAAEWGRIDTMSLLMGAGVDLDIKVGDPPRSQYERALKFAEKNGFMASKRFVQHLFSQRINVHEMQEVRTRAQIQNPVALESESLPSPVFSEEFVCSFD